MTDNRGSDLFNRFGVSVTIVGTKIGKLRGVVWNGAIHTYKVDIGAVTVFVRDMDGDGRVTIGTDEMFHQSNEVVRTLHSEKYLRALNRVIGGFRASFPDDIMEARGKLADVPYSTPVRNDCCERSLPRLGRMWAWSASSSRNGGAVDEMVSASAYDYDLDGRIDEVRWKRADGLNVELHACKGAEHGAVASPDACISPDPSRAGIDGALSLFDFISRSADDARDLRSIFAFSSLKLREFATQQVFAAQLRVDSSSE